jgi:DNA-binding XRE family transcriptional regulator
MKTSYRELDYESGKAIQTLRNTIDLTQAGLAEHLSVSARTVRKWEASGSYPKAEHLKALMALAVQSQALPNIRLSRSITFPPQNPLQFPKSPVTLIHIVVQTHASLVVGVGLAPTFQPSYNYPIYSFINKPCCDVEREATMIKTQPLTFTKLITEAQQLTNTHLLPDLQPPSTPTVPTFTELLAEYNASLSKPEAAWNHLISDESTDPFAIYQRNLANVRPQPVRWLWQDRLPLAGVTLLDGDHGCGKTLLALQIAAHVSSGTPMPDGSPTIQGGVIIVTPHTDSTTTQLQLLTALGADLSCIEILSYIPATDPEHPTSSYRPFSLPEDLTRLLEAIERVDARLVLFDPFISLLSHQHRWTDQRIARLLANLNQRLIERNIACLITRNCHAKGGHARPSIIERSEHFSIVATSRLLLAPDPMQPNRLLLSHVLNRHTALTPTFTLQIQPIPANHTLPHVTIQGLHTLKAKDLIENRPDTLNRRLLSQHLLQIIANSADPIPVTTLYALSPHSSAFQVQRALSDLLRTDQIERPARGFYAKASTNLTLSLDAPATTTSNPNPANNLKESATTTPNPKRVNDLNTPATTTPNPKRVNDLNTPAATTPNPKQANNLNTPATTTSISQSAASPKSPATTTSNPNQTSNLKESATTTPNPKRVNDLNTPATTTSNPNQTSNLKESATTTPNPKRANDLNTPAATTSISQSAASPKSPAAITPDPKLAKQLKPTATTTSNPGRLRPHKGHSKHKNTKKRH